MELKEIKCLNCGGELEFDNKTNLAKCKFCNTTFSKEDIESLSYKAKMGELKAQEEFEKEYEDRHPSQKIIKIVVTIISIAIFATFIYMEIFGFPGM